METTEINSISDLSQILQTLGEPEKGHTRFFRGHGDEGWKLLPSIYRAKHLIENEDKIIKDALTYCPDDFSPSDTLFEKLVKLQHYGYSTRLLDLTANALVALYFATWNKKYHNKNGELIIFDIPNEHIKYGDSDTIAILSAISLRNFLFNISKAIENADSDRIQKEYEYEKEKEEKCKEKIIYEIEYEYKRGKRAHRYWEYSPTASTIRKYKKIEGKKAFLLSFNNNADIISLLHDIQTDKPSFRPVINPSDFNRVLCVRAKLNNARISRQQGCFLLFGIEGNKTEAAAIPDEWQRFASNSQKILVKAKNKSAIMQELKSFGISKRTLFPELEAQATEIMKQYEPQ
ncbi:FRG domain-containing protein [Cardiobacterium valvarum]|uniref:FRG domain n=1 Tax=Cardiobacterium valvarum TaxID=194702 RepID=A0A381E960_9GAMM|nr:FRG domain-containing protein [Cardiobacterium valvarum]SUX23423.1 FRG domain [Cardiobacterium valvarum]